MLGGAGYAIGVIVLCFVIALALANLWEDHWEE